jgi:hypothetical protein
VRSTPIAIAVFLLAFAVAPARASTDAFEAGHPYPIHYDGPMIVRGFRGSTPAATPSFT